MVAFVSDPGRRMPASFFTTLSYSKDGWAGWIPCSIPMHDTFFPFLSYLYQYLLPWLLGHFSGPRSFVASKGAVYLSALPLFLSPLLSPDLATFLLPILPPVQKLSVYFTLLYLFAWCSKYIPVY